MQLANGLYTIRVLRAFGPYNRDEICGVEPRLAAELMKSTTDRLGPWAEDYTIPPPEQSSVNPGMVAVDFAQSAQQDMQKFVKEAVAPLMAMIAAQQEKIASLEERLTGNGKKGV